MYFKIARTKKLMKGIISGWLTTTAKERARGSVTPLPATVAETVAKMTGPAEVPGPTTGPPTEAATIGPAVVPGPKRPVDPSWNGSALHPLPLALSCRARGRLRPAGGHGPGAHPDPAEDRPVPHLQRSGRR